MNRKIMIAICALCLSVFCSCSKSEEQNNSSQKTSETTAVTTASTTGTAQTTTELVADTPPPYMYYSGKTYTSMNKTEETFLSSDEKIAEKLEGYDCVGQTHDSGTINEMQNDYDVTTLPDNAKVYHNSENSDDNDPFIIVSEVNGQTTLYYMNLLSE